jgi:thiol:disulfide interchange protein
MLFQEEPARMRAIGACVVVSAGMLSATLAQAGANGASKNVQVELIPEVQWVQPGTPFTLAVHMRMAPPWHTYWRNPGDSGLATKMRWGLPEGFSAGPFQWPYPETISAPPLMSYGYSHEVTLLVEVTPPATLAAGTDVTVGGRLDWLECSDICIPGKAPLDVRLPVRAEPPQPVAAQHPFFSTARAKLPADGAAWTPQLVASAKTLALTFASPLAGLRTAAFFPEQARVIDYAAPQRLLRTATGYSLELARAGDAQGLDSVTGVLVLESDAGRSAVHVEPKLQATEALPAGTPFGGRNAASAGVLGIPAALGLAFLGGLILNLMPCVLPVLSLKVLTFVRHAGGHTGGAWKHGLAFTAGVVFSFWALAGLLLALRAGGQQIGWGFQLQSPPFVAALACLFFLMGLNLFGVFEVGLSLTRAGGLTAGGTSLGSSFGGGALATIVATPCTAPFMGSALGFGLSQSAPIALAIFTALGLGMAAPYMILSLAPGLLRFVPKPGPWMESFKQLMGFFMMATVVVLAWVFGQQAGNDAVAFLLGGLVVLGLAGWIYGRATAPEAAPRARRIGTAVALACGVAGVTLGLSLAKAAPPAGAKQSSLEGGIVWEAFSPEAVARARSAGKPVFIDFTAAWCLSCQVNERVALRTEAVQARFRAHGITAFKADWTLHDERISEALRDLGRSGVPLYVLYAPGAAEARLLPEVITPDIVLRALDETLGNKG